MSVETVNHEYGKMTEAAIEKLRSRMGKVFPIEQPYIRYVNRDSITHVVRCLGDTNPLYTNPEYASKTRYGKLAAPPAIFYAVAWGSWDMRRGQGLPGVHGLHSGDGWRYLRPVLDGDTIHATKSLVRLDPLQGRLASKMLIQAEELRFYNQDDELVAIQVMPIIRMEREDSKQTGKYASRKKSSYTAQDIAQIDKELKAEIPRGGIPRYWEDVEISEPLDPVVKGPLTVPDMISWLQGVGSPHVRAGKYWLAYREQSPKVAVADPGTGIPQAVERVHWDEYLASEIGMPSAYDYGSQRGGYATYFATQWAGDEGWVAELDVQYRGMVFLGDVFRITGEVGDKWRGAKTRTGYVKAQLRSINNRDENVMPGTVTFALPSRENGPVHFPVGVNDDGRAEG
jgi:acyl dehydratase